MSRNVVSEEMKSRIAAGRRYFYSLGQVFRSRAASEAVKIKLHKRL
jgi:hypothetical protein